MTARAPVATCDVRFSLESAWALDHWVIRAANDEQEGLAVVADDYMIFIMPWIHEQTWRVGAPVCGLLRAWTESSLKDEPVVTVDATFVSLLQRFSQEGPEPDLSRRPDLSPVRAAAAELARVLGEQLEDGMATLLVRIEVV